MFFDGSVLGSIGQMAIDGRRKTLVLSDLDSRHIIVSCFKCGTIFQGSCGIDWSINFGAIDIDVTCTIVSQISSTTTIPSRMASYAKE